MLGAKEMNDNEFKDQNTQNPLNNNSNKKNTVHTNVNSNNTTNKRKLSFNEQRELDQLNTQIPTIQDQIKELESKLTSGSESHEELLGWSSDLEEKKAKLDGMELRWLELSEME